MCPTVRSSSEALAELIHCDLSTYIIRLIYNHSRCHFLFIVQVQVSHPFPHRFLLSLPTPTPTVKPSIALAHESSIHVPLLAPAPSFPHTPSLLPSGHCQFVLYFHVSGSVLLICLFCLLGSTERWDHSRYLKTFIFLFYHSCAQIFCRIFIAS